MSSIQLRPLKIVDLVDESKIILHADVLNSVLDKVGDRHFALYSINGKKRTGKSFMLNYFACFLTAQGQQVWRSHSQGVLDWFTWRCGANPETNGIDIWPEPFIVNVAGREIAILLMDTQGNFDDQTSTNQNACIFAISTLISSVMIFNVMNNIGEDVMQFLHLFTGFANLASNSELEDSTESPDNNFQKLVFLMRDMDNIAKDYAYGYYDSHVKPAGQRLNYKTDNIDPNQRHVSEVRETHRQICRSFGYIGVQLLPEPGKGLRRDDRTDNLDEEFKQHAFEFVERILAKENIVTKKVGGLEVTGTQFKKSVVF